VIVHHAFLLDPITSFLGPGARYSEISRRITWKTMFASKTLNAGLVQKRAVYMTVFGLKQRV
jgi:hypothetical protein